MRPGAVRRRPGSHPPGGELLLNFELDVLVGEALGLLLAEDEHGFLTARVHEKLHVPRRGVVAGRIHEVLGDRDEPQVDARGLILARCRKMSEQYRETLLPKMLSNERKCFYGKE